MFSLQPITPFQISHFLNIFKDFFSNVISFQRSHKAEAFLKRSVEMLSWTLVQISFSWQVCRGGLWKGHTGNVFAVIHDLSVTRRWDDQMFSTLTLLFSLLFLPQCRIVLYSLFTSANYNTLCRIHRNIHFNT